MVKQKKLEKTTSAKKDRTIKILKIMIVLCVIVLLVEGIYIAYKALTNEKGQSYIDTLGAMEKIKDGYIAVGSSDFKHSKYNKYTKGYEKAKLVKYNEKQQVVFEKAYTKGFNSYFYDVKEIDNGYIAVGAVQKTSQQIEEKTMDGLLVLYNKDGDQQQSKTLQILGNTKFTKVAVVEDGYLVIGQSILENMTIGNDPNGGGIMIKYDENLNEIWRTNYGGSKSGIFSDLLVEEEAIYIVGKDATRYGIFAKYTLDGKQEFVKNYEYTDTVGFSSLAKIGENYVVVGGKTMNNDAEDKDKITQALLVKYDQEGNILFEKTYRQNKSARFNKVLVDGSKIIAIGHSAKKDEKESNEALNVFRYSGLFAKYEEDGETIVKKEMKGSRDIYFSDLLATKKGYTIIGQTSSKELGGNNKDLKSYFLEVDKKGKKLGYHS